MKPSRILGLAAGLVALGLVNLPAEENPIEKAAVEGRIKVLVPSEKPDASIPPDLITLKTGQVIEVQGLEISGTKVDYMVRTGQDKWERVSLPKNRVLAIEIGRTLADLRAELAERERKAEPFQVVPADRQPVPQEEILAGKFVAHQGRYTRWTFSFTSEMHKYFPHADNATEYGTFKLRSHFLMPESAGVVHENEVIARGKYFLFAPGTMGNQEWVLNLSDVTYAENDISPRSSFFTERLRDEVFILRLSPDRNVFSLVWANHTGWQWTSPIQQTFYRDSGFRPRELPEMAQPGNAVPAIAAGKESSGSLIPARFRSLRGKTEAAPAAKK